MKERPILFSGEMVRAILEGRKTQTRRNWKMPKGLKWDDESKGLLTDETEYHSMHASDVISPYGRPGDRLWVRETWGCHWATDNQKPRDIDPGTWSVLYFADDQISPARSDGSIMLPGQCRKKRPSIFMPRWASRITLEITGIRVERLQDISEDDCEAEGMNGPLCAKFLYSESTKGDLLPAVIHGFSGLWESINGPYSWNQNPWVWVVEFKRLEPPTQ